MTRSAGGWICAVLAAVLAWSSACVADEPISGADFDAATGFRTSRYRAPLPQSVSGSQRIFAADVPALIKEQRALLIDVMAAEGAGFDPGTGAWRLSKLHDNIPGSVWLPDVGRGVLDARMDRFFRGALDRLTGGDRSRALIIYCQSDCWMSFNAIRRAVSYGYTQIYWLPEGIDGWRDWDGPVAAAVPEPVPP